MTLTYQIIRLKCDRQTPCISCIKRGQANLCTYAKIPDGLGRHDEGSKASQAQLRLQKLEAMVTSLMKTTIENSQSLKDLTASCDPTFDWHMNNISLNKSSVEAKVYQQGDTDYRGSEPNYRGATYWTAILDNVASPILLRAKHRANVI